MKRIKNIWQTPEMIPFAKEYKFVEANVTSDGLKIIFCTRHPYKESNHSKKLGLWMMDRIDGKWQKPEPYDIFWVDARIIDKFKAKK